MHKTTRSAFVDKDETAKKNKATLEKFASSPVDAYPKQSAKHNSNHENKGLCNHSDQQSAKENKVTSVLSARPAPLRVSC